MTEDPILKAVEALLAAGYMVEPIDADPALWRVNGDVLTSAELLDQVRDLGLLGGADGER